MTAPIRDRSWLRDVLLPYREARQAAWTAAVCAAALPIVAWADAGAVLPAGFCAVLVASIQLADTAPATSTVAKRGRERLLAELGRMKFVGDPGRRQWVPPMPRWLRWRDATVTVERGVDDDIVHGPLATLRLLHARLREDG